MAESPVAPTAGKHTLAAPGSFPPEAAVVDVAVLDAELSRTGERALTGLTLELRVPSPDDGSQSVAVNLEFRTRGPEMELVARSGDGKIREMLRESLPELAGRLTGGREIDPGGVANGADGQPENSPRGGGPGHDGSREPGGRQEQQQRENPRREAAWSEIWRRSFSISWAEQDHPAEATAGGTAQQHRQVQR
jgi:hypothetical protein